MAGNSQRRGAVRTGNKKGPTVGSGGQRRRGSRGGPTPKARRPRRTTRRTSGRRPRSARRVGGAGRAAPARRKDKAERRVVVGRNPVRRGAARRRPGHGAVRAGGIDSDERVREALKIAAERGIPVLEVPRGRARPAHRRAVHQGLALQIPPYEYAHPTTCSTRRRRRRGPADRGARRRDRPAQPRRDRPVGGGVRRPRRGRAERRAAGMTASAWKTSAGAAARIPVARATNLNRAARGLQEGRPLRRRPRHGRRGRAGRPRAATEPLVARRRLRGQGPVPAGARDTAT